MVQRGTFVLFKLKKNKYREYVFKIVKLIQTHDMRRGYYKYKKHKIYVTRNSYYCDNAYRSINNLLVMSSKGQIIGNSSRIMYIKNKYGVNKINTITGSTYYISKISDRLFLLDAVYYTSRNVISFTHEHMLVTAYVMQLMKDNYSNTYRIDTDRQKYITMRLTIKP